MILVRGQVRRREKVRETVKERSRHNTSKKVTYIKFFRIYYL